jgi:hypothetical protein
MRYSKKILLLAVGFLSSLGCQALNLDRCHPNSPYLRDSKPAYLCDAQMHCVLDPDRVNVEKLYFNQLINEIEAVYKDRTP